MASEQSSSAADSLTSFAEGAMKQLEEKIGQHFSDLRDELLKELGKAGAAGLSLGSGAGATAVGGALGTVGLVHLVHEITGMPLSLCYFLTAGTLVALGAGLVSAGVEQASQINLVPGRPSREREERSEARHREFAHV